MVWSYLHARFRASATLSLRCASFPRDHAVLAGHGSVSSVHLGVRSAKRGKGTWLKLDQRHTLVLHEPSCTNVKGALVVYIQICTEVQNTHDAHVGMHAYLVILRK